LTTSLLDLPIFHEFTDSVESFNDIFGTEENDYIRDMLITSDGSLVLVGFTDFESEDSGDRNLLAISLSSDGDLAWGISIQGASSSDTSILGQFVIETVGGVGEMNELKVGGYVLTSDVYSTLICPISPASGEFIDGDGGCREITTSGNGNAGYSLCESSSGGDLILSSTSLPSPSSSHGLISSLSSSSSFNISWTSLIPSNLVSDIYSSSAVGGNVLSVGFLSSGEGLVVVVDEETGVEVDHLIFSLPSSASTTPRRIACYTLEGSQEVVDCAVAGHIEDEEGGESGFVSLFSLSNSKISHKFSFQFSSSSSFKGVDISTDGQILVVGEYTPPSSVMSDMLVVSLEGGDVEGVVVCGSEDGNEIGWQVVEYNQEMLIVGGEADDTLNETNIHTDLFVTTFYSSNLSIVSLPSSTWSCSQSTIPTWTNITSQMTISTTQNLSSSSSPSSSVSSSTLSPLSITSNISSSSSHSSQDDILTPQDDADDDDEGDLLAIISISIGVVIGSLVMVAAGIYVYLRSQRGKRGSMRTKGWLGVAYELVNEEEAQEESNVLLSSLLDDEEEYNQPVSKIKDPNPIGGGQVI